MITGDAAATAATVARAIGLAGPVCAPGDVPDAVGPNDFAVYAGIFPEQKFRLVKAFQQQGHAIGMCGDGANDAPALLRLNWASPSQPRPTLQRLRRASC